MTSHPKPNKCIDCGKPIDPRSTRCPKCSRQAQLKPIEERFWEKVDKNGPIMPNMETRCWVWIAAYFRHKFYGKKYYYGNFTLNGKAIQAHRYSWMLAHNKQIPRDMFVCHKCDNPKCVNPDHLFLGTHTDNMRDMADKGRTGTKRGRQNFNTRLTSKQVIEIRERYSSTNISQRLLAQEYGVSQAAIWYILHKENWKHV